MREGEQIDLKGLGVTTVGRRQSHLLPISPGDVFYIHVKQPIVSTLLRISKRYYCGYE